MRRRYSISTKAYVGASARCERRALKGKFSLLILWGFVAMVMGFWEEEEGRESRLDGGVAKEESGKRDAKLSSPSSTSCLPESRV